jgi:hypothetical protein
MFTVITRIIARAVFTFFSTSNLIGAQIHRVLRLKFNQSTAGTHELFGEFPSHLFCHVKAGHLLVTNRQSPFRVSAVAWGGAWASARILALVWVWEWQ